jgi:hypothetical protein
MKQTDTTQFVQDLDGGQFDADLGKILTATRSFRHAKARARCAASWQTFRCCLAFSRSNCRRRRQPAPAFW